MFDELARITARPEPFSTYTVETLWTDPHVSEQMLRYHLDAELDSASRRREFVDRSVAWIVDRFELAEGRRVLDLGCGPGLYTNRLAAAGATVTGIDLSARSIDHARRTARERGLEVDHAVADYLDDPPAGPFDVALLIYCDLCALGPDRRARLLANVRDRLARGGVLLFDVVSLARFVSVDEGVEFAESLMDGFWSSEPYFGFHSVFVYDDERVVLDRYDIVERDRTWSVSNWLQHYDPDTLERELASAGFELVEVLGDVAGAPYDRLADEFAVIARPD
jgi:SAM-dependent methyltransferase